MYCTQPQLVIKVSLAFSDQVLIGQWFHHKIIMELEQLNILTPVKILTK